MADQWSSHASVSLGRPDDRVTMVEGSAFMICAPDGDVSPLSAEGFFFRDTRFLSRLELRVNGQRPEALAVATPEPYAATFVGRRSIKRPNHGRFFVP